MVKKKQLSDEEKKLIKRVKKAQKKVPKWKD